MNSFFKLILALLLLPSGLAGREVLYGKVKSTAGEPLAFASVRIIETKNGTYTDASGNFSLPHPVNGRYTFHVRLIGFREIYKTIIFPIEKDTLEFLLEPDATSLDEVIVQSTRITDNGPMASSKVSKEDIQKNNYGQDVPYLLNTLTSVVTTSDAGAGFGYTGIRIRGSDPTRINVTINGIPINDAESQGMFWVDMPDIASGTDNIQVQRGVGSSTNGAGAFGGSINLQTMTLNREQYGEINSGYGSFNTIRNTVKLGTGLINDKWALDARLSKINSDGYIDRASADLKSYYLQGSFFGKKSVLKAIVFSGLEKTYQAWNGVVSDSLKTNRTFNELGLYTDPSTGKITAYENQVDNYQQDYAQLHYSHQTGTYSNFNVALHYTRGKGYYEEFREGADLADYGIGPIMLPNDTIYNSNLVRRKWLDNHFYGLVSSWNRSYKKMETTVGAAANQYIGTHFGNVIWSQFAGNSSSDDRYYENDAVKNDANVYAKIQYAAAKKISVFGDVQYRFVHYTYFGPGDNNDMLDHSATLSFFNPKGGVRYALNDFHTLYASASAGAKEPSRSDFVSSTPASRPRPEKMLDYEAGWRCQYSIFNASVNLYHMDYTDQLVLTGEINDVGNYNRTNIGKSSRSGAEFEFYLKTTRHSSVNANFTISRNKIDSYSEYYDDYDNGGQIANTYSNTDIAFSPRMIGALQLNADPKKWLNLSLTGKYVGKQYLDNTQNESRSIDAYYTADLRIATKFAPKKIREIGFGIQLNNLLNTLYVSNGYTYGYFYGGSMTHVNYYYPQAGFNVMTMLTLKF